MVAIHRVICHRFGYDPEGIRGTFVAAGLSGRHAVAVCGRSSDLGEANGQRRRLRLIPLGREKVRGMSLTSAEAMRSGLMESLRGGRESLSREKISSSHGDRWQMLSTSKRSRAFSRSL